MSVVDICSLVSVSCCSGLCTFGGERDSSLFFVRVFTGERALPPSGLAHPVGDSDDSDELEVDGCEGSAILSSWLGTKMTETQLSSESRLVSLWMLPSLLLSLPPSPLDSLRSCVAASSGHSRQQRRRLGERSPDDSSRPDTSSHSLGDFGEKAPFLWKRPRRVALSRLWSLRIVPNTLIGSMLTPFF